MIEKRADYQVVDAQPLNTPNFSESFIKDQALKVDATVLADTLTKIANSSKESSDKSGDAAESPIFDLEAEISSHPDSLFIKCFAIKANETNENGDYFSVEELMKATPTFVGVPLFTNHANSDINEARGKVVHSWWDDEQNGIMIIGRVDAAAYPQLARGIKEEYVVGTSMGCFTSKCRVLMANGTYLPISEVQDGDLVYTHKGRTQEVLNAQIRYKKEFIKQISFEGYSSVLEVTKEHPILTLKNPEDSENFSSENLTWTKAQDLGAGDSVLDSGNVYTKSDDSKNNVYTSSGSYLLRKIKKIDNLFYEGPVYNLQVAKDNSYVVEDVAVKNCQVQYSLCSICHNYAETPDQYCSHIREQKTREVHARKVECAYHKHGNEEQCPICGSRKGEKKVFAVSSKAFEYNYGIKFIENSFVVNPACPDCGVTEVIDPHKLLAKIADIQAALPNLLKVAAEQDMFCSDKQCVKLAGQAELDSLNQALDLVSSVSQSMLSQKEQLDLEFLSDLVKVLADLQTVVDELTEQGYGRLQSPSGVGADTDEIQKPTGPPMGDNVTRSVQPLNPTPGGGSKIQTGPAGQVGTVTGPMAHKKLLQLQKLATNLIKRTEHKFEIPDLQISQKNIKLASQRRKKRLNLRMKLDTK